MGNRAISLENGKAARRSGQWVRSIQVGLTGGVLVYLAAKAIGFALDWRHTWPLITDKLGGSDHAIYLEQARRVLAGGPLYPAYELAGTFTPAQLPEVYPPATVYGLFVPMALLPDVLWWAVPLTAIFGVIAWLRPKGWTLLAILALLATPGAWICILGGNPSMWVVAGMCLATVRPGFAAFALVKTTLWPLALFGIRSRAWWIGMAVYGVVALLMLPAWLDYLTVLSNYRAGFWVPSELPLLLIPLVLIVSQRLHDADRHP